MRILRHGWKWVIWVALGSIVIGGEVNPTGKSETLASGDKSYEVLGDGRILEVPLGSMPAALDGCTSEVVEKFLRRAIRDYEDLKNPPRYSDFIYIVPGDQLGEISKNGHAKSISPNDPPAPLRGSVGQ